MAEFSSPHDGVGGGPPRPRAGFGERFVAALVDGLAVGLVGLVLQRALGLPGAVLNVVFGVAYYTYLEGSPSGQTLGKRAMSIRVLDRATERPLTLSQALLRYLARIVSTIPCLLGYFWMLWDPEKQTWHDKLAGSVVVPTSAYPVTAWPG